MVLLPGLSGAQEGRLPPWALPPIVAEFRAEYGMERRFALDRTPRSGAAADVGSLQGVADAAGLELVSTSTLLACPDDGLSEACRLADPRRILRLGRFQATGDQAALDVDLFFAVDGDVLAIQGFRADFARGDGDEWRLTDLRLMRMH